MSKEDFINKRISQLHSNITPVPLHYNQKVVLHLVPFVSIDSDFHVDITRVENFAKELGLIGAKSGGMIKSSEEILSFSNPHDGEPSSSYTQIFNNGVIEAVSCLIDDHNGLLLPRRYEDNLLRYLPPLMLFLEKLSINPPVYVYVTFMGIKGCKMGPHTGKEWCKQETDARDIKEDIIRIDSSVIENYAVKPNTILRPMFDRIWMACGFQKSHCFDEHGNWIDNIEACIQS